MTAHVLPIRICSGRKSGVGRGFLHEIYTGHMLQAFFKAFERHGYAVLSRKLGICLSNEKHENYGDWEEKGDEQILAMLREQAENPAFEDITFIYWNHRPLTHAKWVRMLADAGFHVIERRTLADIRAVLARSSARPTLDSWAAHDRSQEVEG
ncbi:MAG: hypothetical protein JW839_01095 [Candidatus Lokiarchaeota archaeon]|nr:hypothetical protein [Candidatus Lokiarchaeota archaeon]